MDLRRRRIIGIAIAVLLFGSSLAISIIQLRVADRRGWAGFAFFPQFPKSESKTPRKPPPRLPFGWSFGAVFMTFPDAPADRAGIKPRDVVLRVNGASTDDPDALRKLDSTVKTGDVVTYHIRRNGRELDIPVSFRSPVRSWLFIPTLTLGFLVSLIFFVTGLIVFLRRSEDRRVTVFFAMTVVASIYLMNACALNASTPSQRGLSSQQTLTSAPQLFFFGGAVMFFAPLLLHLALVFPKPRPIFARLPVLRWVYGPPIVIAIAVMWTFVTELLHGKPKAYWPLLAAGIAVVLWAIVRLLLRIRREGRGALWREPLTTQIAVVLGFDALCALTVGAPHVLHTTCTVLAGLMYVGTFAAYPTSTVISLYRGYRDAGVEEKRQVKWPLWATILVIVTRIAVSTVGGTINFLSLFGSRRLMSGVAMQAMNAAPYILYVLIPIAFAFAIAKYRLMNIDLIIRRTVLYSILTAVVFVLYGTLVIGLGTLLVKFAGLHNQTMVIASTIVVALVAVPLRNRLQTVVDRNVFRERVDYPLALQTIGEAAGRGAPREEILRITAEQLQQALQNRFVLIVLRSDQHFIATAKVGLADEVLGTFRVPVAAVDLTRPLELDRDPVPAELRQRVRALDAALLVPMRAQRASVGFLVLGSKLSNEPFAPDDVAFLESAASQLAFSLESSRMKNEEEDFDQARAMQQVLLPKSLPQIEGFRLAGMWQPARSVGGDYYDAIPLAPGKVAICIADVAGKGMPAALLMAGLQTAVKATATTDISPRRVCGRILHVISSNLTGGTFITFFYGVLDAATRSFTYCNAGHNPPLLVRASGAVESLETGGAVLGRLFAGDPYDEATVTLGAGDRVILFTDGVTEARRGEDDFGEARLVDVVRAHRDASPEELQERIVEAITTFTSGSFGDDVTLVIIGAE